MIFIDVGTNFTIRVVDGCVVVDNSIMAVAIDDTIARSGPIVTCVVIVVILIVIIIAAVLVVEKVEIIYILARM